MVTPTRAGCSCTQYCAPWTTEREPYLGLTFFNAAFTVHMGVRRRNVLSTFKMGCLYYTCNSELQHEV